jgi:putative ABC transport system substrate-binding protein
VDVLVVAHTAIPAAMQATRTIPVVCPTMDDPVRAGFAASFARPGGNLTGLYGLWDDTDRKVLELAMEVMPSLRRAGAIFEATDASVVVSANTVRTLARARGVAIRPFAVHNLEEIEAALAVVDRDRLQALFLYGTPLTYLHHNRIMDLVSREVPVISDNRDFAAAGALLTYGASIRDMWRRGAVYVDKILKGAKPGDLPIERPNTFDLVINLKTAKTFGITVPESILLRADEIIR